MSFKKIIFGLFLLSISVFVSCDKDFLNIGSDVIGNSNFDFEKYSEALIVAHNQSTGPVQSNNLPVNPLGILNNPAFGKTTAHFVTQIEMQSPIPTFTTIETPPSVEKVVLYIPYFSRITQRNEDGSTTYAVDSLYGTGKIDLKVYENGYFLRNFSPESNFTQSQKYFSNDLSLIDANKKGSDANGNSIANGTPLNDSDDVAQNVEFKFSDSEIVEEILGEIDEDGTPQITYERRAPGLYLTLNKDFFDKKIFGPSAQGQLSNNNVFKNYFRGLYFKVSPSAADPNGNSLMMLNFRGGQIMVTYNEDTLVDHDSDANTPEIVERKEKKFNLNLTASAPGAILNAVSLVENTNLNSVYAQAITQPNIVDGDERLYLKGNDGAMAVINLFGPDTDGNGIPDQLEEIRTNGWLINEANLVFHIDQNTLGSSAPEPNRIFIYDLKNNTVISDYLRDGSTNTAKPKFEKTVFDGIIKKEPGENGRGLTYKVRITDYVSNLIRKDSTNTKLGLVITEEIRNPNFIERRNPEPNTTNKIPQAAVMNPLGTVLYGNNVSAANQEKRLKLEIYYTKPN
jgi:hypothetical protein